MRRHFKATNITESLSHISILDLVLMPKFNHLLQGQISWAVLHLRHRGFLTEEERQLHTKQFVYGSALAPGRVLSQRPLNQWKDVLNISSSQPFKLIKECTVSVPDLSTKLLDQSLRATVSSSILFFQHPAQWHSRCSTNTC